MKACVIHDYEEGPKVEDVTVLDPQPGEVLVRIAASGVCGSDMHVIHGRSVIRTLPLVLGHEGAHSARRIIHAGGDATGAHIELTLAGLARMEGITVREHTLAADLVMENGRVTGVRTLDALHLGAARRLGTTIGFVTFDVRQALAARSLGFNVVGV